MNPFSPTAQGFRVIFRRPSIPCAEIAWRWSFAAATWFLLGIFVIEYMDTLPVKALDRLLLATQQPILILRAFHRILYGSAFRFTVAALVLGIALAVAWVLLASLGRAATVNSVLEEVGVPQSTSRRQLLTSLIALHSLRVMVALAAVIGSLGAALLTSSVWASTHLSGTDAVRFFGLIVFLVWLAWSSLNWWLAAAAIAVVTKRTRALEGIALTATLCQEEPGPMFATGAFFGFAHLGASVLAGGTAFVVLVLTGALGPRPVLFLELVIVVGYCLVEDFLYVGRLAACVYMFKRDELPMPEPGDKAPSLPGSAPSAVDPHELILSDLSTPAG